MKDELILRYIKATVNFYGIVHIDKFVEIYNMQNEDKIDKKAMRLFIEEYKDYFFEHYYPYVKGDYFVSIIIMAGEKFEEELKLRKGKPYYIPEKEELLKYEDPLYFKITPEYIVSPSKSNLYQELTKTMKFIFGNYINIHRIKRELHKIFMEI